MPNPSFEDTVMCPDAGAQVAREKHWYAAANTPDYFHECNIYSQISVPNNIFDFQYAATGFAYCGFYPYGTIDTLLREEIGVELLNPLEINKKYYVSFKLNATSRYANGACNKIGLLFSTIKYIDNTAPIKDYCQVWTDSIITDTTNWVQIFGSFIADSSYSFITLSAFFVNSHIDTIRLKAVPPDQNSWMMCYYFIDDVCVSEDSILCTDNTVSIVNPLESRRRAFALYPNPANIYLSIETEIDTEGELELYTLSGQILLKQKIPRGRYRFHEDVSQIANGIYFLKLLNNNQTFSRKIIIHH